MFEGCSLERHLKETPEQKTPLEKHSMKEEVLRSFGSAKKQLHSLELLPNTCRVTVCMLTLSTSFKLISVLQ